MFYQLFCLYLFFHLKDTGCSIYRNRPACIQNYLYWYLLLCVLCSRLPFQNILTQYQSYFLAHPDQVPVVESGQVRFNPLISQFLHLGHQVRVSGYNQTAVIQVLIVCL